MKSPGMKAYWPLIKNLLIPGAIMKFILALVFIIYAGILVAIWINKGQDNAANAVLPMMFFFAAFYFFEIGLVLPHHALVMVSNKSLRYLTDFRKFYFAIALIFSLTLLLMSVAAIVFHQGAITGYELYLKGLQFSVLISAYVLALFVVTYRFPAFQGIIFVTFLAIPYMLDLLALWYPVQLIGVMLIIWSVFAFWWLRLKPQKSHVNVFTQSMEQMASGNSAGSSWLTTFLTPSSRPLSFLGARLMGMSDSYAAIFRMWFFTAFITLLFFIFFKWLLKDNFNNFIKTGGVYFVVFLLAPMSSGIMIAICRNVKSLWLYFPGSRCQMFTFIEKKSISYTGVIILVFPILVLIANAISGFTIIGLSLFIWVAISICVINLFAFYFSMAVYSRDSDNKSIINPLNGIVVFVSSMIITLINILLTYDFYVAVTVILLLILLSSLLLRYKLIQKWQQINFVRVS